MALPTPGKNINGELAQATVMNPRLRIHPFVRSGCSNPRLPSRLYEAVGTEASWFGQIECFIRRLQLGGGRLARRCNAHRSDGYR